MLSVFREMGKPKWSEIFFVKRNSSKRNYQKFTLENGVVEVKSECSFGIDG